jgi:YrbI family 3-deoxy-D-manno-octulosonate 8-phosphate phosphatase
MKTLNFNELSIKASQILYFFSDVDGTLTNGVVLYSAQGEYLKQFSFRDGTGFYLLQKLGIIGGIITGEKSEIVIRRAEKLKLKHCFLGIDNKLEILEDFLHSQNCTLANLAYIGDDLNDLNVLSKCGLSFCPSDAVGAIKERVDIICENNGGFGAFRDAVEHLIYLKNKKNTDFFSLLTD